MNEVTKENNRPQGGAIYGVSGTYVVNEGLAPGDMMYFYVVKVFQSRGIYEVSEVIDRIYVVSEACFR